MTPALLALFLALSGATVDEMTLATAIQGERPDLVTGDPVLGEHVGQVVLNRLDAGWCDSIQQCVNGGFWGAKKVGFPDQWALDIARRVIERKEITNTFYAFGLHDCEALGLKLEDSLYYQRNGVFGIAFYGRDTEW